jgi:hypothetical protein
MQKITISIFAATLGAALLVSLIAPLALLRALNDNRAKVALAKITKILVRKPNPGAIREKANFDCDCGLDCSRCHSEWNERGYCPTGPTV